MILTFLGAFSQEVGPTPVRLLLDPAQSTNYYECIITDSDNLKQYLLLLLFIITSL